MACIECADEISLLEEQVKTLKDCLAPEPLKTSVSRVFSLEYNEAVVLTALLSFESRSRDDLLSTLYYGRDDEPWGAIVTVYVCKLRKKTGIEIGCSRRRGYFITKSEKERVKSLLC